MRILNFGSLNIDYVYKVDHFVRPGETLSSEKLDVFCGGKGLNQSIALAHAGAEVFHAGGLGKADGGMLKNVLDKNNINTDLIKMHDSPTGHAIIQIDKCGQNCIMLFGGTNLLQTKEYIDSVINEFSEGDYIILQNEINLVDYIMEKAHEKGMKIVLNPSPMNEKILALPLSYVDYFLLNEVEASDICPNVPKDNLIEALCEKFPDAVIVLTLGKQGVMYSDGKVTLSHGIYKVPVIDTTAAGDTFSGFFIASISGGKSPEEALRIASVASSIAVSRYGAETSIPQLDEVLNSNLTLE